MSEKADKVKARKPYRRPMVERVRIEPTESVLAACKQPGPGGCPPPGQGGRNPGS